MCASNVNISSVVKFIHTRKRKHTDHKSEKYYYNHTIDLVYYLKFGVWQFDCPGLMIKNENDTKTHSTSIQKAENDF